MVSFHKALAETPKTEVASELEVSSRKRKWEEPLTEELFKGHSNSEKRKSIFGIELPLETPLPSNKWQPYLSIQSGQIHLCNRMINMKPPGTKRSNIEPEPSLNSNAQMSLDLELNLTCDQSLRKKEDTHDINEKKSPTLIESSKNNKDSSGLTRSPSWLSSDDQGDHKEMVATVCMRCHMLVMLCKSSPACPNCKFMHPPDQNPSKFLQRRRCSLLC